MKIHFRYFGKLIVFCRNDLQQNPPVLPQGQITSSIHPGVMQQGAVDIPTQVRQQLGLASTNPLQQAQNEAVVQQIAAITAAQSQGQIQAQAPVQPGLASRLQQNPVMMNIQDLPSYLRSQGSQVIFRRKPDHQQPPQF